MGQGGTVGVIFLKGKALRFLLCLRHGQAVPPRRIKTLVSGVKLLAIRDC